LDKYGSQFVILRSRLPIHHQIQRGRMRKLRRIAKPAVDFVKHRPRPIPQLRQSRCGYDASARRNGFIPRHRALDHPRLF